MDRDGSKRLQALNPDGSPRWNFTVDTLVETYSSPALDIDGDIYFGADGLYAISSEGAFMWRFPGPRGTPLVARGRILLTFGYEGNDAYLYAMQLDGSLIWKKVRIAAGDPSFETPAVGCDDMVYTRDGDGYLYSRYPYNGTERWRVQVGNAWRGDNSPTVGRDCTVYVPHSDRVVAVDPDGSLRWSYTVPGGLFTFNIALGPDGTLYFATTQDHLVALNPDGALVWDIGGLGVGTHHNNPAVSTDGILFIGSDHDDGTVYALNPDGSIRWRFITGDKNHFHTTPALDQHGNVYIGSMRNHNTDGKNYTYAIGNLSSY